MKTQIIKTRNIPNINGKKHTIHVKPDYLILLLLALGVAFMFSKTYMIIIGFVMILLALFAEFIMPDRNLCTFTNDFVVLFNRSNNDECTLVYWDEVVSWKYEWHGYSDLLIFSLIDGTSQSQEMYSKLSCIRWLELYAAGKEIKSTR